MDLQPVLSLSRRLFVLAAALVLAACASVPPPPPMSRTGVEARACATWYEQLDEAVDAAGVRDAGAYRVPGHPYLRADRFTASFRAEASSAAAFDTWVARLRGLDRAARDAELRGLHHSARGLPPLAAGVDEALQKVDRCGRLLVAEDLATDSGRERLRGLVQVPDDYAGWVRATGVYAIARVPFGMGVDGWHREAEEMFRKAAAGEAHVGNLRRVDPAGADVGAAQVRELLARTPRDALGVPQLAPQDEALLLRAYAPRYEIETLGPWDRFGALTWGDDGVPRVDTTRPVVYRRLVHTRFEGRVRLQLVYTLWFPERPRAHALDLLGGTLDGLVMRVTLADDGTPLVWDTIHPCGCYHMFFPTAALKDVAPPDPKEEWAFIPARLPAMPPAGRVAVRTASATHYLVAVQPVEAAATAAVPATTGTTTTATATTTTAAAAAAAETYTLVDEDTLRALPLPGGGVRSIYGPDALVRGTERGERFFFWPMGIASPGTMRQWGRHPTAFLGRRHFDDADLIERRFTTAGRGAPVTADAAGATPVAPGPTAR